MAANTAQNTYDASALEAGNAEQSDIVVRINGELAGNLRIDRYASKHDIELAALDMDIVRERLRDGSVKHTAFSRITALDITC